MNRLKKWQIASSIFDGEGINNAAFAYSIMQLGQSEQLLIQLESKLYRHITFGEDLGDIDYFSIDSLLKNWIFGLYEILRSFRANEWQIIGKDSSGGFPEGKYKALDPVFKDIALLRIPLAKIQPKGKKDISSYPHVITHEHGPYVGWRFNTGNSYTNVYRHKISDDFLTVAIDIAKKNPNREITKWLTLIARNVGGSISIEGSDTIVEDIKTPSILIYARCGSSISPTHHHEKNKR